MSSIDTLVTDPNAFFRDRSERPSWKGPVLIVTLIAVLGVVSSVIQFRATAELYTQLFADAGESGETAGTIFQVFQVVGMVVGFVVNYVVWVLFAVFFYGVSALLDGNGEFSTTLKLVGWGLVPSVVGSVFSLFITVYRYEIEGVTVPADVTAESIQQFSQQVSSGPLVMLTGVLGVVFTLWSGVLWTFAMKHARQLTTRNAAITVALPVLFGIAVSLWSIINAL